MASVKVVLFKHKTYKDGTHPVRVEVIHNRKRTTKTLFSIFEKDWDEKSNMVKSSHKHAASFNSLLATTVDRCTKRILDLETKGEHYTSEEVFSKITESSLITECVDKYIKDPSVSPRTGRKYKNLSDKIEQFKPGFRLGSINESFMRSFESWLFRQEAIKSKETVGKYLKFLKTIARKYGITDSGVLKYRILTGHVPKVKLTRQEFESIRDLNLDERLGLSRDCFCLMTYMRGIRIGDCLQLQHFHINGDRAKFIEQKTGKSQDISIRDEAKRIIDRYKGVSDWYVLPMLMLEPADPKTDMTYQKHIEVKTSVINRDLKLIAAKAGINKHISSHVARHTFAMWALENGVKLGTISQLLNHSSVRVTDEYLRSLKESDRLDEADDKVHG